LPGFACGHTVLLWPSFIVVFLTTGAVGAAKRRLPTGGWAYLMFEKLKYGCCPEEFKVAWIKEKSTSTIGSEALVELVTEAAVINEA
jgi:hypothetical protein